jgi:hypothetical protein
VAPRTAASKAVGAKPKTPAKKAAPAKKAPAKKSPAKKSPAKKSPAKLTGNVWESVDDVFVESLAITAQEQGGSISLDDADTELGRRRSIDEAVRLGDRRAADKNADRRRVTGQMFEKISDLGAMEHHGPAIEQEHPIEG